MIVAPILIMGAWELWNSLLGPPFTAEGVRSASVMRLISGPWRYFILIALTVFASAIGQRTATAHYPSPQVIHGVDQAWLIGVPAQHDGGALESSPPRGCHLSHCASSVERTWILPPLLFAKTNAISQLSDESRADHSDSGIFRPPRRQ